jgi:hypothetical protein
VPLSNDPVRRERQLANLRPRPANLKPGAGQWEPGHAPVLTHGLRSRRPSQDVMDPMLDQVIEDLEAKVPVRDKAGDVPAWLREECWAAGIKKLQVIRCARYLAQRGETDGRGNLRPENEGLVEATEAYERSLDRLAMTVGAHMRAGADLARTVDAATAMSEPDPERRARLLRRGWLGGRRVSRCALARLGVRMAAGGLGPLLLVLVLPRRRRDVLRLLVDSGRHSADGLRLARWMPRLGRIGSLFPVGAFVLRPRLLLRLVLSRCLVLSHAEVLPLRARWHADSHGGRPRRPQPHGFQGLAVRGARQGR